MLDGQAAATELQILDGRTVYALRADFDRQFEEHSPGTYLNWRILEGSFDGAFDTYAMGTGANPYKLRWANATRTLRGVRVYQRTPRAQLVRLIEHRLLPLARRVRARLNSKAAPPAAATDDDAR
jgi:CelD/BcsL family acetyltransferase involved in cellulose biosynthesis